MVSCQHLHIPRALSTASSTMLLLFFRSSFNYFNVYSLVRYSLHDIQAPHSNAIILFLSDTLCTLYCAKSDMSSRNSRC